MYMYISTYQIYTRPINLYIHPPQTSVSCSYTPWGSAAHPGATGRHRRCKDPGRGGHRRVLADLEDGGYRLKDGKAIGKPI